MTDGLRTLTLPDLGEGLTEAQIVSLLVKEGAPVSKLDAVVEVETDKATSEVTSPWQGTVTRILVAEGQWLEVGDPILEITVT